ncbi:bifunctional diguanylate cyclase/phosphodiesterase [Rhizobium paknamense]|uniref:Diguanylate cyclase (GGDEF)-like protein n=1 Tax=Rhizobium paknamense TaxID=1206817 RepID=A0ABU0IGF0_9HYPH|nr:EAL domain-containing protein [Rhizobium paknamense]MDQ0456485.1 diguanylate cyclase (GGDEF)-like protein [Rhizobium paknamense]
MLMRLQNTVLEMIAKGQSLSETVDYLCRTVEQMIPDIVCSVLRLDEEDRLLHLAGPSIPPHYSGAINGLKIGDGVGSCGTAAFRAEPVLVQDIETHPYWAPFKSLALPLGYLACWSTPILSQDKVLGTFAFYFRSKRGPSEIEQAIVDACVHLCAIGLERELRNEERRKLAYTDVLTGLPNRARFNEVIAEKAEHTDPWGLLLIDLDNLKMVNDTFGHKAGDDLIRSVAHRIQAMSDQETVFRLGGDEFALIITGKDCIDLGFYAGHVLDSFKTPCFCAGQTIIPAGTIGGAVARNGDIAEDVRQNADFALYEAKERCRGHYLEYGPSSGSAIARRYRSIQQVSDALRDDQINAYYQPLIRLSDQKVIGFEALCRMRLRNGDMVSAGHFQDATSDVQVARDLTARMLDAVTRDARNWMDRGLDFGRLSINVSAADFIDGRLPDRITTILDRASIPFHKVGVEITETVYLTQRDQNVIDQVRKLRQAGISVALDDFGTGYASLTHLLTVPVDIIKIDKCFTERLLSDRNASVIVESLLSMCTRLGYEVTAEGIETEEQHAILRRLGCQIGQGYLFSKAMASHEVANLLVGEGSYVPGPVSYRGTNACSAERLA